MNKVKVHSLLSDFDIELFKSGKHFRLYEKLGSHPMTVDGEEGTYFAVWAPSAKKVSVIGNFNYWIEGEHTLNVRWDESGIWEGFIPGVKQGDIYKYKIFLITTISKPKKLTLTPNVVNIHQKQHLWFGNSIKSGMMASG